MERKRADKKIPKKKKTDTKRKKNKELDTCEAPVYPTSLL